MGEIFYLEAGEENAGERIDAFLASEAHRGRKCERRRA